MCMLLVDMVILFYRFFLCLCVNSSSTFIAREGSGLIVRVCISMSEYIHACQCVQCTSLDYAPVYVLASGSRPDRGLADGR